MKGMEGPEKHENMEGHEGIRGLNPLETLEVGWKWDRWRGKTRGGCGRGADGNWQFGPGVFGLASCGGWGSQLEEGEVLGEWRPSKI